jgi:hypothetical protein
MKHKAYCHQLSCDELVYYLSKDVLPVRSRLSWGGSGACCVLMMYILGVVRLDKN